MNSFDSESSLSLMDSGAATQTQSGAAIVSRVFSYWRSISESSLSLMESGAATQTQSGAGIVSGAESARPQMHQLSIAVHGFTILSGIVGLLQLVNEGPPIFSVYVFICLFSFSSSTALSPPHSSICIHISFFFGILASASFLSLAVPNKLSWAPYLSCTYPALHLLSADFRLSLRESCTNGWNAAIDAASRAHQAVRSCVCRRSGSSPSSAGSLEEGCSHGDVNGNNQIV